MKRIILMVLYNLPFVPYWWWQLCRMAKHPERYTQEERWKVLQKIVRHANKGGRVKIEAHGIENIPQEENFIFFRIIRECLMCWRSWKAVRVFAVVNKKEVRNVPLLKQAFAITGSLSIDREDIRQSMGVINQAAQAVRDGVNF